MADTLVLPYAERLVACLCEALQTSVGGPVCRCSLAPGTAPPPADSCCDCGEGQGQASVQITDIFAVIAGQFPKRAAGVLDNCGQFEWAAELTMTVYRCVSGPDQSGNPPTGEQLADDMRKIASDAQAMRRALLCCSWRDRPDGEPQPIIPGSWKPLNPLGNCAGGQMSVTVLLGSECCPPPSP